MVSVSQRRQRGADPFENTVIHEKHRKDVDETIIVPGEWIHPDK